MTMTPLRTRSSLAQTAAAWFQHQRQGLVSRLWRDERAVSAVEFALLLPFMLVLYIGGNEVGQSIAIYRKVAQVSYTMGDLVSQVSSVTTSDVSNILDASTAVMMPYNASGAQMVLGALTYNGSTYTVAWSQARNTTAWTAGLPPPSTISVPTNLVLTGQQVIVAQVTYTYTSVFTAVMTNIWGSSSISMGDSVFLRPRLSATIPCTNC